MMDMKVIDSFDGDFRFLSNFWFAEFEFKGRKWQTSEHAYQAMKSLDPRYWGVVALAPTPVKAKKLGNIIKVREDWEKVKGEIMRDILIEKFTQNPELLKKLKATGDANLIEGNTWHDNTWGDCSCEKCRKIQGHNMLGNILMWIREAY